MAEVIPFGANITEELLKSAAKLHNQFPPDSAFPNLDNFSDGFNDICAIIAKYKAQDYFRLRLLHRHTTIPEGHVLLGSKITQRAGFWTRPTPISAIDLRNIRPHIISVSTSNHSTKISKIDMLMPSEFREGCPVAVDVGEKFFTDITDCIRKHNMENVLGLEVVHGQIGKMIEFTFDSGSLLLSQMAVKQELESVETGWAITVKDGLVEKDGETRCLIAQGKHIKATKAAVKGWLDALKDLQDEGVI